MSNLDGFTGFIWLYGFGKQVAPCETAAIAVACGYSHSLYLTKNGEVFAFGINSRGQLGDGTTEPKTTPVACGMAKILPCFYGCKSCFQLAIKD